MSHETQQRESPFVAVRDLCKDYGKVRALDRVSFRLCAGEILGLLGPNGAGKTTAIDIILGLLTPTSGSVQVLGTDPLRNRQAVAGRVNFSSGDSSLPANLKVRENLKVFARLYGIRYPDEKIRSLLETVQRPNP